LEFFTLGAYFSHRLAQKYLQLIRHSTLDLTLGLKAQKVKVEPETYKIIDGKLYLFYNFGFTNTLKFWNKDEANLLPLADRNWEAIID